MEKWREVWRKAIGPFLPEKHLSVLLEALVSDDAQLLQGATTTPPPLQCMQDWPVAAACALSFCGWQGDGLKTVAEVVNFFGRTCFEIDARLAEPAGCRWFLNWFDETPRDEVRRELQAEIEQELRVRLEREGVVS